MSCVDRLWPALSCVNRNVTGTCTCRVAARAGSARATARFFSRRGEDSSTQSHVGVRADFSARSRRHGALTLIRCLCSLQEALEAAKEAGSRLEEFKKYLERVRANAKPGQYTDQHDTFKTDLRGLQVRKPMQASYQKDTEVARRSAGCFA